MRLPGRTAVRRVVLAVLAAWVGYVVGANLFLASAWGRRVLNLREERLRIDYDRALTPWPGMVWVRDLRVRGQSPRMQWLAAADRASGRIALLPLVGRSFRIAGLRGTGVVFLLRRRLDAVEAGGAAPELQPAIPGLENPPRLKPERIYRTRPPESSWTVVLSGCRLTDVSELWLDHYRLTGEMELQGGMRLRLKRTTTVRPTTATLRRVQLEVGDRVVASDLSGEVRAFAEEYRHREHRGLAATAFFTGDAALRGHLESLGFLNFYLRDAPWLRFVEGSGELSAEVSLDRGSFRPGSRFCLSPARFAATVLVDRAAGDGSIVWSVSETDETGWSLDGLLDTFTVWRSSREAPHVEGEGLRIEVRGRRLLAAEAWRGVEVVADLPLARVPDLTFYNAYIPSNSGLSVARGSGTIRGHLEAATGDGTGRGEVEVLAPGIEVEFEGVRLVGDLTVHGVFPEVELRDRCFRIDGSEVRLDHAGMIDPQGTEAGDEWWAAVSISEGRLTPGQQVAVAADFRARLLDSRPAVALVAARRDLPGWMEKIVRVRDLEATGKARLGKGRLEVDDLLAEGDRLEVRARLRRVTPHRHDLLLVRYGALGLGLERTDSGTRVKVVRPVRWFEARLGELTAADEAVGPSEALQ